MDKKIETLHSLCENVMRELETCSERLRKSGGDMSSNDVEYLDKLTHMLKSIKTTIAMMESEGGGYSEAYMPYYGNASFSGGDGMGGASYRGGYSGRRYARRDSMGRYSRDGGYSYADGVEDMLQGLPEEKLRDVKRYIEQMR